MEAARRLFTSDTRARDEVVALRRQLDALELFRSERRAPPASGA
jgi:hypothetical protein